MNQISSQFAEISNVSDWEEGGRKSLKFLLPLYLLSDNTLSIYCYKNKMQQITRL